MQPVHTVPDLHDEQCYGQALQVVRVVFSPLSKVIKDDSG